MRGAPLVLALLVYTVYTALSAAAQEPVDTTLTIQGFLQRDNEHAL